LIFTGACEPSTNITIGQWLVSGSHPINQFLALLNDFTKAPTNSTGEAVIVLTFARSKDLMKYSLQLRRSMFSTQRAAKWRLYISFGERG
jgi:hypothetical protein